MSSTGTAWSRLPDDVLLLVCACVDAQEWSCEAVGEGEEDGIKRWCERRGEIGANDHDDDQGDNEDDRDHDRTGPRRSLAPSPSAHLLRTCRAWRRTLLEHPGVWLRWFVDAYPSTWVRTTKTPSSSDASLDNPVLAPADVIDITCSTQCALLPAALARQLPPDVSLLRAIDVITSNIAPRAVLHEWQPIDQYALLHHHDCSSSYPWRRLFEQRCRIRRWAARRFECATRLHETSVPSSPTSSSSSTSRAPSSPHSHHRSPRRSRSSSPTASPLLLAFPPPSSSSSPLSNPAATHHHRPSSRCNSHSVHKSASPHAQHHPPHSARAASPNIVAAVAATALPTSSPPIRASLLALPPPPPPPRIIDVDLDLDHRDDADDSLGVPRSPLFTSLDDGHDNDRDDDDNDRADSTVEPRRASLPSTSTNDSSNAHSRSASPRTHVGADRDNVARSRASVTSTSVATAPLGRSLIRSSSFVQDTTRSITIRSSGPNTTSTASTTSANNNNNSSNTRNVSIRTNRTSTPPIRCANQSPTIRPVRALPPQSSSPPPLFADPPRGHRFSSSSSIASLNTCQLFYYPRTHVSCVRFNLTKLLVASHTDLRIFSLQRSGGGGSFSSSSSSSSFSSSSSAQLGCISTSQHCISALAFNDRVIVSGGRDATLQWYQWDTLERVHVSPKRASHHDTVTDLLLLGLGGNDGNDDGPAEVSSNGGGGGGGGSRSTTMVSASLDASLKVWDVNARECVRTWYSACDGFDAGMLLALAPFSEHACVSAGTMGAVVESATSTTSATTTTTTTMPTLAQPSRAHVTVWDTRVSTPAIMPHSFAALSSCALLSAIATRPSSHALAVAGSDGWIRTYDTRCTGRAPMNTVCPLREDSVLATHVQQQQQQQQQQQRSLQHVPPNVIRRLHLGDSRMFALQPHAMTVFQTAASTTATVDSSPTSSSSCARPDQLASGMPFAHPVFTLSARVHASRHARPSARSVPNVAATTGTTPRATASSASTEPPSWIATPQFCCSAYASRTDTLAIAANDHTAVWGAQRALIHAGLASNAMHPRFDAADAWRDERSAVESMPRWLLCS